MYRSHMGLVSFLPSGFHQMMRLFGGRNICIIYSDKISVDCEVSTQAERERKPGG